MAEPQVRWVKKTHRDGCYAVEEVARGDWPWPWAFVGKGYWGDRLGRRNGSSVHWALVVCNDAVCHASFAVRWDAIEGLVTGMVEASDAGGGT